ncbi:MAG: lysophospholipid acyltransferase family protein [Chloroflexota bacterium]
MFYEFIRWLTKSLLLLLTDCHVSGIENVPPSGPLIVLSNHLSNVDPPLVGSLVPRTIRFVAKEELFKIPLFGLAVRGYGALPLRRGAVDRRVLRRALEVLRQGGVVGMFPEGHRSRDCQLQRGQAGATLMALQSGAPLLPVAIVGSRYAVRHLWRRPRIDFTIGPVFRLEVSKANPGREELERLTDEMMLHIAELLPEELRGWYRGRQPSGGGAVSAREDVELCR